MSVRVAAVAGAALLVLTVVLVFSVQQHSIVARTRRSVPDTSIRLGTLFADTGNMAQAERPLRDATKFAIEQFINQDDTIKIEVYHENTKSCPNETVKAVQRLYDIGVRTFVGLNDYNVKEVVEFADQHAQDAIFVSPTATLPTEESKVKVLKLSMDLDSYMKVLQSFIANNNHKRVVAIVDEQHGYFADIFAKIAKEHRRFYLQEIIKYRNVSTVRESLVDALKGHKHFTAVCFLGRKEDLIVLLENLNGLPPLHIVIYALEIYPFDDLLKSNPSAYQTVQFMGLHTVKFVGDWSDNPNIRRLMLTLQKNSDVPPTIQSPLAIDATNIALEILCDPNKYSQEGFLNTVSQIKTLTGNIKFTKSLTRESGEFLRLVLSPVMNNAQILHKSFWLLQGQTGAKVENGVTKIERYEQDPADVMRREDLNVPFLTQTQKRCKQPKILIKSYDSLTFESIQKEYPLIGFPQSVVLTTVHGYQMSLKCNDKEVAEFACIGSRKAALPNRCMYASNADSRRKRQIHWNMYSRGSPLTMSRVYTTGSVLSDFQGNEMLNADAGKRNDIISPEYLNFHRDRYATRNGVFDQELSEAELQGIFNETVAFKVACAASFATCGFCWFMHEKHLNVSGSICAVTCMFGIGSSCMRYLGEHSRSTIRSTVICTELYEQGLIDLETYMADVKFGARLSQSDPFLLEGYRSMASPLVWTMKRSSTVTQLVKWMAQPWMNYMKHSEGFSMIPSETGEMMMKFGGAVCLILGAILQTNIVIPLCFIIALSLHMIKYKFSV